MVDCEMLSAIADLLEEKLDKKLDEKLDKKLEPIYERFDRMEEDVAELKTDVAELKTNVAVLAETTARLERDVAELKETTSRLNEDMKRVKMTLEHSVLPRLNTIEGCYLETSKRYLESADQIDDMYADIDVLKYTVRKHSEKLQRGRRIHRATGKGKTNIVKEDESV